MAVNHPGFSERVFEFSFNSEYAQNNRALLASAPQIPTQNAEKWLGYDVEFQLKKSGGAIHSVALQHKVARFVDGISGSNKERRKTIGGPYFVFWIDVDQFNLIESFASSGLDGVEFVYCAPLFTTLSDMDAHYLANTVSTRSIWIDPAGIGSITDGRTHSIVYDATKAFVFSGEPRPLTLRIPRRRHLPDEDVEGARPLDLRKLYEQVYARLEDYWPRREDARRPTQDPDRRRREALPPSKDDSELLLPAAAIPPGEESAFRLPDVLPPYVQRDANDEPVQALAAIFSQYLGMSWLLELK